MKKLFVLFAVCGIITIAGCGKKENEVNTAEVTPTVTVTLTPEPTPTPTPEVTQEPLAGTDVKATPIVGIPVSDDPEPTKTPTPTGTPKATETPKPTEKPTQTTAPEATTTPAPESFTSKYVPSSGYYANGSDDDFYYMNVVEQDAGSFNFSICKGESGSTVYSGTAVFKGKDSSSAVFYGNTTLYFDCSSSSTISVSGANFGSSGNTFWNTDVMQAG